MAKTRLIIVGGFLGAGKTTLLAQARQRLVDRGLHVGVITNDQADNLVDTALLGGDEEGIREVSGGCFCCRFGCLLSALDALAEDAERDVLLAEPVGSCADISATVLQPLKEYYSGKFTVAPFSVLVDPARLREVLSAGKDASLPEGVSYIFRKQLEEADLIALNKTDLLGPAQIAELKGLLAAELPGLPAVEMSAMTGRGIDDWLAAVMGDDPAGRRITEMDYDTYAAGEASLGWLNATVQLRADAEVDWRRFCADLLAGLQRSFCERSAEIAHVKLLLACPPGRVVGNLTDSRGQPAVRATGPSLGREASLTLNARVHTDPDTLRRQVAECLRALCSDGITAEIRELQSFSPAYPRPEHRFDTVVPAESE